MSVADEGPTEPRARHTVFWCLYDFGNSAFPALVLSFVFAPYFMNHIASDPETGQAQWGFAISASAIIIASLSPVFGAFADRSGRRRPWLGFCSLIAVVAAAALWWLAPGAASLIPALVLVAVANAAFELGYVFYNAMLPDVCRADRTGMVSGCGWGAGYLGSLISLLAVYFILIAPDQPPFGLDPETKEQLRVTALVAAAWFAVFALPLVVAGPRESLTGEPFGQTVRLGLADLWQTVKELPADRPVLIYLVAHMVYIDGVNTLFVFGPLIAVGEYGFPEDGVMLLGITIYVMAGLGSFGLGWLDDRIGASTVIAGSLVALIVATLVMLWIDGMTPFWIVAGIMSIFFGPVQASSRTLMIRLAPPTKRVKLLGLYSLAGRATAPLGPALVGVAVLATDNQRAGIVVVTAFLVLGLVLLMLVRTPARPDAQET